LVLTNKLGCIGLIGPEQKREEKLRNSFLDQARQKLFRVDVVESSESHNQSATSDTTYDNDDVTERCKNCQRFGVSSTDVDKKDMRY
jgi:hypothetical protein